MALEDGDLRSLAVPETRRAVRAGGEHERAVPADRGRVHPVAVPGSSSLVEPPPAISSVQAVFSPAATIVFPSGVKETVTTSR